MKALLHVLKPPSAATLAQQELEEAQRGLLQAQSAAEYARSLATYHEQRIKRLKAYLHEHHAKEKQDDAAA